MLNPATLVAALLVHFRSLQASLSQFLSVRPLFEANTMMLDESALRDLGGITDATVSGNRASAVPESDLAPPAACAGRSAWMRGRSASSHAGGASIANSSNGSPTAQVRSGSAGDGRMT